MMHLIMLSTNNLTSFTVNNLTKHSTIQNQRTYNPQNLSYQGVFDIYNPQFNAKNVMEFDIDEGIVKKVLAEYEKDVAPLRETGYSSENICVVDPYKTVWKEQVISTILFNDLRNIQVAHV